MLTPVDIMRKTGQLGFSTAFALSIFFRNVTYLSKLVLSTFSRLHLAVKNFNLSIEQMYIIGLESIPLVAITSIFVGGETVIQAMYQFSGIVPLRYLGMVVSKSMVTELCPVITSLVVSNRISTAIAAEIGSMKTSEQLDAMVTLNLDPIRYLIVPKTLGAIIMLPVLSIFSLIIAYIGSIITALLFVDITMHVYLQGLRLFFNPFDVYVGILKTVVFGAIIALTGSHFGFQARKGAQGVGEATTKAVMVAAMLILVFDFIIAFLAL
ncbi:MAG: MlaE family ABC transporter permease [Fibrobacterota bacterium]